MRTFHLTLILIATLSNLLPGGSPFRPLFDLVGGEDSTSGDVIVTSDPERDPILINLPPPR